MRAVRALSGVVLATTLGLAPRVANAQCVDEELKQELIGGRHYRGVQERLFTKAFRHELSVMGGWYAADLYSSNYVLGGAYTFHFSEDLALEASFQYTRFHSDASDTFDRRYPQLVLEQTNDKPGMLYFGHLIWSFAYGKLRWMGGGISRFDFNLALGAGVTDDSTSRRRHGQRGHRHEVLLRQVVRAAPRRARSHPAAAADRRAAPRERRARHARHEHLHSVRELIGWRACRGGPQSHS